MQYVAVSYPWSERRYTYHNDGEPVEVGDDVAVADGGNPGLWVRVRVVEIVADKPAFATKPILRRVQKSAGHSEK